MPETVDSVWASRANPSEVTNTTVSVSRRYCQLLAGCLLVGYRRMASETALYTRNVITLPLVTAVRRGRPDATWKLQLSDNTWKAEWDPNGAGSMKVAPSTAP